MVPRDLEGRNEAAGLADGRSREELGVLKSPIGWTTFWEVNKEEFESQTSVNGRGVSVPAAWWGRSRLGRRVMCVQGSLNSAWRAPCKCGRAPAATPQPVLASTVCADCAT
jgi:hypothetical protein